MKELKKIITKYGFLLLSVALIVSTAVDYKEYRDLLLQIEQKKTTIDTSFDGWIVAFSFIILCVYEFIISNRLLKLSIRILLSFLFVGLTFKNVIPMENFNSGMENTTVFSGTISLILLMLLGWKKIRKSRYNLQKEKEKEIRKLI